jgi:hypothetical protein
MIKIFTLNLNKAPVASVLSVPLNLSFFSLYIPTGYNEAAVNSSTSQ